MTASQTFEHLRFMTVVGTSAKVDRASDNAGVDRGSWLRAAIAYALANPANLQSQFEPKET